GTVCDAGVMFGDWCGSTTVPGAAPEPGVSRTPPWAGLGVARFVARPTPAQSGPRVAAGPSARTRQDIEPKRSPHQLGPLTAMGGDTSDAALHAEPLARAGRDLRGVRARAVRTVAIVDGCQSWRLWHAGDDGVRHSRITGRGRYGDRLLHLL